MRVKSHKVIKSKVGTVLAILVLALHAPVFAGIASDPTSNPLSARPIGMGNAFTAVKGESAGIFINPAGIESIRDWQLSMTSSTLLTEIKQNTFTGAYKSKWGTFGIGFVDINSGGSYGTMRDPSNMGRIIGNPSVEAMGVDSNVLALSYAKKIEYMGELTLGVNMKTFNQTISGTSDAASRGTALDFDLGAVYSPDIIPWLTAGFSYQNALGSGLKWSGASNATDSISSKTRLGVTGRLLGKNAYFDKYQDQGLIAAFDIELPRSSLAGSGMLMHAGAEWKPVNMVSLRLGLDQASSGININYGIGMERNGFRFDYAFKGDPVSDASAHIFTLSFAPEPEAPKPLAKAGIYVIELSPPLDRTSTSSETVHISGKIVNAYDLTSLKVNGRPLMPLVTGNSFEAFYYPLQAGPNILSIEASVTSPEAEKIYSEIRLLRTADIKDIKKGYFAKDQVNYLNRLNLMKGYSDGSFKPDKPITRTELVTMLVKAKGVTLEALPKTARLKDVKKDFWGARFIYTGVKMGLVSGYSNRTFKPDKPVTRAESAVILTKFDALVPAVPVSSVYSDILPSHWAAGYINTAQKAGWLSFLTTASYEANRNSTRGEIAYMLSKTDTVTRLVDKFFSAPQTKEAAAVIAAGLDVLPPPDKHETKFNSIIAGGTVATKDVYGVSIDPIKCEITNGVFGPVFELKKGENLLNVKALDKAGKEMSSFKRIIIRK